MPTPLLIATFLLAAVGSEPTKPPVPDQSPDPIFLVPLHGPWPEATWFLTGGSRHEIGIQHPDGSDTRFCWADRNGSAGISHQQLLYEAEFYRRFLVLGSRIGVENEAYLGHGFSVGFDLGVHASPLSGPPLHSRVCLIWYPIEAVSFQIGYHAFWGWDTGWQLQF
jgi:hypothetical protein